jgi:hypothetical protein
MPLDGFEIAHYADFGTGEPWLARIMFGLPELVYAVPAFGERRAGFMEELGEVFYALGKSFEELRQLRLHLGTGAAELTVEKSYESFYGHLWRAYKDRFPRAMKALGLDIGFLFQKDAAFEKGVTELLDRRAELADLIGLMRRDRAEFQNVLAAYRNDYLEHRNRSIEPRLAATFHQLGSAQNMFENAWQAIEDYVVLFTIANLPPAIQVAEIPEDERDTLRPTRFRFVLVSPLSAA